MDIRAIAEQMVAALAARYPERIVTRSLIPVEDRPDAELAYGVITVLVDAAQDLTRDSGIDVDAGAAKFLITGQIWAGTHADGAAVENAELALFNDLYDFAREPGLSLCPLNLTTAQFSGQTLAPEGYGWLVCEAVYQELD